MAKEILSVRQVSNEQNLMLIKTGVSNARAGNKYGTYSRLSLILINVDHTFVRITNKNCKLLKTKIFRESESKDKNFKKSDRYKDGEEYKTLSYFLHLMKRVAKEERSKSGFKSKKLLDFEAYLKKQQEGGEK